MTRLPRVDRPCSVAETSYFAFLRHGAYHQRPGAPSARQPYALTDDGKAQARAGAELLADMVAEHRLDLAPTLYSSRQLRAWQTADILRTRFGTALTELRQVSALAERGMGSAANLTVDEIEAVMATDPRFDAPPQGWKSDSRYCLPLEGAESLMQAGERVARHLQDTQAPGKLVVHVGHGASFRHACLHLGLLDSTDIPRLSMFYAKPLLFCYSAHGSWQHLAGQWKVRAPKEVPID